MTIRLLPVSAILISWWLCGSAAHADSGLDECAELVDNAERLACYDRVARESDSGRDNAVDTVSEPAGTTPDNVAPASATAAAAATLPPATESPSENTAGQPAGVSEEPMQAEADFGVEPRMQRDENKNKLREIYANVVSIDRTASGKRVFRLDNGQIWLEQSKSRSPNLKPGDSVRIKAGSFGSYKLFGDGKVSTKVERIR